MTLDYHKPNQVVTQIVAAVPGVVSLIEQMNPSLGTLYASIDLANTFFSIPVNEDYQKKFAFSWQDQHTSSMSYLGVYQILPWTPPPPLALLGVYLPVLGLEL